MDCTECINLMGHFMKHFASASARVLAFFLFCQCAPAQDAEQNQPVTFKVDASAPAAVPLSGHLHLSATPADNVAPDGEKIDLNSQYLIRNGVPWLPVMGEFHYSRSPAVTWDTELKKMKSAGISVVSSYVIWSHHEELEGRFNWQGNRDLNRFLRLCKKNGLMAMVRIGPWSHAEVRFGGLPDWVVNAMPTRSDDPQYLHYVGRFYQQIGMQLAGQLWKQGGPVIGIQIENEFNLSGALQGAQHIHTLKLLAQQAGMAVPLYTVTGWDATIYPQGEVVPVFGGYPDEPWGVSQQALPPKETYAFRFGSRVSGDLGAQTVASEVGSADLDLELTPFLGAEYGAGLPAMYRRRTVVSADDIAAMLPVQLGSGVNLLGYYMFYGGRNPLSLAGTGMQESTLSGGYNDTPMISYDFQAPLGPDGQQRSVLTLLRPYHYFLNDFGARLAPMTVRKPEQIPAGEADLSSLRWSVRSQGEQAFVFVNNHVRQYPIAAHDQVRFSVQLPHSKVEFPQHPVTVQDGSYFIWPVNFDMEGATLRYGTVQPLARLDQGKAGVTYVFSATEGIAVELGFARELAPFISASGAQICEQDALLLVQPQLQSHPDLVLKIARPGQRTVTMLILSPEQTRQLSIGRLAGQRRLIVTSAQSYFDGAGVELHSAAQNQFRMAVYPALSDTELKKLKSSRPLQSVQQGLFQILSAEVVALQLEATGTLKRAARPVAAVLTGGVAHAAQEPKPESFSSAATWRIALPEPQLQQALHSPDIDDVLLGIDFVGDIGRLFSGISLIDDWYYWGYAWQIGLKNHPHNNLALSVLPLRQDAPIYLPNESRPDFSGKAQIASLNRVTLIPVYKLTLH